MPEIILIADIVGCTVTQLTSTDVTRRVECAARSTNGVSIDSMRQRLIHFLELDAYLDGQGILAR